MEQGTHKINAEKRIGTLLANGWAQKAAQVGALLTTDKVVGTVRRILRRLTPGLKVDESALQELIATEIVKRDVSESDQGIAAQKKVHRQLAQIERNKKKASQAQ